MRTSDTPTDQIPVTLLTGFLGSGKTTLLNQLVRQPALADALVIINEFGEMALDHLLVAHSADQQILEIGNGCLCCTVRSDLAKTLRDIPWRFSRDGRRQFGRVWIETTGLADPAPVIQTLLSEPALAARYRLDGILATVDLATGDGTLDAFPEAVKQIAVADGLLLTKGDLATDEQRRALEQRLSRINPGARRWHVAHGDMDASDLVALGPFAVSGMVSQPRRWLGESDALSIGMSGDGRQAADCAHDEHEHEHEHEHGHGHAHDHDSAQSADPAASRHDDRVRSFGFVIDTPIPEAALAVWIESLKGFLGDHLLRIKGIVHVEGQSQPWVIHGVQHVFHPPARLPAWPDADRRSRIVFITRDMPREPIAQLLRTALEA